MRAVDTSQRPFVLIWELTQACELTCDHCRADAQPDRHPDELTTAEGKRLLDQAREFGDNQLVVLSGGDPLKRDDVAELVEYGTDRGLLMTLTPSGTASLTRERVEALADAGLRRLALSLDGSTAERHDEFRGEEGSFQATVEAAELAREAGIPLQVNTTVCARTVDDLPEIRDRVAELGAVLWSVFFLVPVGRGVELDPVPAPKAEQVMGWLADVADEAPFAVKTTEAPHYRRVRAQRQPTGDDAGSAQPAAGDGDGPPAAGDGDGPPAAGDGDGPPAAGDGDGPPAAGDGDGPPAGGDGGPPSGERGGDGSRRGGPRNGGIIAGDGFAFVSHVGEVYPSGFLPESAGNVREASIVDIYRNADLFEKLRDRSQLRGKCGACEFRNLCGGSRSRAYAHTGDPLASDPLCPYVPEGYDGPMPGERASDGRSGAPGD